MCSSLPILVIFNDRFVSLARVAIVTNGVVRGGASTSEIFHRKLSLIRKLHVGGAFDQAYQGGSLSLKGLFNRVIFHVKDQDVLVEVAFIRCLDSNDDEEAELFLEHILFA